MKRIIYLFVFVITLSLVSCSSQQTTYDIGNFSEAMNYGGLIGWTIDYMNEDNENISLYSGSMYALSETETLYFVSHHHNPETWDSGFEIQQSYVDEGEGYVYLILINEPDSEQNSIRYPSYKELCNIFEGYMIDNPMTTTTCNWDCD